MQPHASEPHNSACEVVGLVVPSVDDFGVGQRHGLLRLGCFYERRF